MTNYDRENISIPHLTSVCKVQEQENLCKWIAKVIRCIDMIAEDAVTN